MFSEQILILGDGTQAKALQKTLGLFCDTLPQSCEFGTTIGETSWIEDMKKRLKTLKRELRKVSIIITTTNNQISPYHLIQTVFLLRNYFWWKGGFIAMTKNFEEKKTLESFSVLGDPGGNFQFNDLPGHSAFCYPILITDLLTHFPLLGKFYKYQWLAIRSESRAFQLKEDLLEAEELLKKGKKPDIVRFFQELLKKIREIDWMVLLKDRHKDPIFVDNLINLYPPGISLRKEECMDIIKRVKEILFKSILGESK